MKKKIRIMILFVALLMSFSLVACGNTNKTESNKSETDKSETDTVEGNTTDKTDKKFKIVAIGVQSGGSYWGNIERGFIQGCALLGLEGSYWTPQNAGNDSEMVQLAENALTQGYDAICMEINDLNMYGDIIKRAKEQGVALISMTDIGEEYCSAFVGIDSYASGHSQGVQIAKFANELGYEAINYVTLMSTTDNPSQLKNRQGVADAIKENFTGSINEIDVASTDSNAATAQDKLSAFYLANPNLNAVACADLYGALGASQFVAENGLQGKFIATGLELTADAFNRVLDGDLMATSSVDSVGIGEDFCNVAQKILNGEEYEYSNPARKIWVLKEDVEQYCKENDIDLN